MLITELQRYYKGHCVEYELSATFRFKVKKVKVKLGYIIVRSKA